MANDSYTEVMTQSWGSRIGDSIKGFFLGIILVPGAILLLSWNEGRSVKMTAALTEVASLVTSKSPDVVDPSFDHRLVHMSGLATTSETIADPQFGVSAVAIGLKRKTQMYQWKQDVHGETQKNFGGSSTTKKTYTYSKMWSKSLIRSNEFKQPEGHENPSSMPFSSSDFYATKVTLGAFELPRDIVRSIGPYEKISADPNSLPAILKDQLKQFDGGYYIGASPASAQIGDLEIDFQILKPTSISVIATQVGNTFEPYFSRNGNSIELVESKVTSPENMIENARIHNEMLMWVLRVLGVVLTFFGFLALTGILSIIADIVPILGTIIGVGTTAVAFLMACATSFITIGIAWIAYRPLLGISLFASTAVLLFLIHRSNLQKKLSNSIQSPATLQQK